MISRPTRRVANEDFVWPRLPYCDLRCSKTWHQRSQVCRCRSPICHSHSQVCHQPSQLLPGLSAAVLGLSAALLVPVKAGRNALQLSDTLLKLTHLCLHSTFSQTLLEASSDYDRFC
jgi:hypothetical protein